MWPLCGYPNPNPFRALNPPMSNQNIINFQQALLFNAMLGKGLMKNYF